MSIQRYEPHLIQEVFRSMQIIVENGYPLIYSIEVNLKTTVVDTDLNKFFDLLHGQIKTDTRSVVIRVADFLNKQLQWHAFLLVDLATYLAITSDDKRKN
jgi:hypothetical protein